MPFSYLHFLGRCADGFNEIANNGTENPPVFPTSQSEDSDNSIDDFDESSTRCSQDYSSDASCLWTTDSGWLNKY